MFLDKKKSYYFSGNQNDQRGYSSVNHFVKLVYKNSNLSKNFIKNYGNKDLVIVSEIYDLYNKYYKIINGKNFKILFKSKIANKNSVPLKKSSIFLIKNL